MSNTAAVRFLYGTIPGRTLLRLIQTTHLDRTAVHYLCSPLSRHRIPGYIRKNHIQMDQYIPENYATFRDFFVREKKEHMFDSTPGHLISPCDGWLSVFPIEENSSFSIKNSRYRLSDLLLEPILGQQYRGGFCLIFRLCASDYHHFCFIDDGTVLRTHAIEGQLHSVQPIACEAYPVYTLNRRFWSLLDTVHFGPVIQTEIGALIVGGIVNEISYGPFCKGMEKGHFELSGSTITLMVQKGRLSLLPELAEATAEGRETRVTWGMHIGNEAGG